MRVHTYIVCQEFILLGHHIIFQRRVKKHCKCIINLEIVHGYYVISNSNPQMFVFTFINLLRVKKISLSSVTGLDFSKSQ